MRFCCLIFGFLLVLYVSCESFQDPYKTLGVSKRASLKEIKRAYKALAREWHPDKNEDPNAQEKFVLISKAYELLSDPLKRERYDKFGTFDDTPKPEHHHYGGFDQFFGGFEDSFFSKQRISLRQYTHTILARSHYQPFLIYAYSNYCHQCFRLLDQWKVVTEDLEPLGYGIGTVNAFTDGNLLEKLRISHLPQIVAVVEGRVIPFRENVLSINAKKVRMFARSVIPNTYFDPVHNHASLRRFVDTWKTSNKISVLIVGAAPEPRLRYLLTAMKYSDFARFGYVYNNANTDEVDSLRDALSIKCKQCENVLIFNDIPENGPVSRLSISNINQLTIESLNNLIDNNKFVSLPRLSSMEYFDELCPVSSRNPRYLCAILPVIDNDDEQEFLESWNTYTINNMKKYLPFKLRLVYVYANKQATWLRPFLEKRGPEGVSATARDVLVIWRTEHVKARFRWLPSAWNGSEQSMNALFTDILAQKIKLTEECHVGNLDNEYALSWWTRACRTVVRMWESAWYHLSKEEAYPVLSAVATFIVILLIGYGLNYMNQDVKYKKDKTKTYPTDEWHPDDPKVKPDASSKQANPQARLQRIMHVMSPLMHELRAESYYGMIRLLKPGCRSLVVLVDEESKDRLLPQFAAAVFPIRNNKTFSFGYLMVDKNLPWFRKLLEHTLPLGEGVTEGKGGLYERLKAINPRQTVGTVLALCGWKLYFSIYHPMHTAGNKNHFLGFDDDESDDGYSFDSDEDCEHGSKEEQAMLSSVKQLNTDNVLNGFPIWLDNLLEGSIRRYYIPEWPDNLR